MSFFISHCFPFLYYSYYIYILLKKGGLQKSEVLAKEKFKNLETKKEARACVLLLAYGW
jgi:hypothetical protein